MDPERYGGRQQQALYDIDAERDATEIEVSQSAAAHKVSGDKVTSLTTALAALSAGDTFTINGGLSFRRRIGSLPRSANVFCSRTPRTDCSHAGRDTGFLPSRSATARWPSVDCWCERLVDRASIPISRPAFTATRAGTGSGPAPRARACIAADCTRSGVARRLIPRFRRSTLPAGASARSAVRIRTLHCKRW